MYINLDSQACDMLLAHRVEAKLKSKNFDGILNRVHVAMPKPRDGVRRPPVIPEGALKKKLEKASKLKKRTERDIELELGDDYILDLKKNYDLPEEYKYDVVPEFWLNKNIADYIDPDIMQVRRNCSFVSFLIYIYIYFFFWGGGGGFQNYTWLT